VSDLKPVYLVAGDDDERIDAWRRRVRVRAEEERGPGGLESFDGRSEGPEEVAAALAELSFATGTRYLLVEGADAWKAGQLAPVEAAMAAMPPDTVLVLIVRGKPLKQLVKAVEGAGGDVRDCPAPKPWELPKWVVERSRDLGLQLEPDVAKELVSRVGTSQQRLARELEKLAVAIHPSVRVTREDLDAHAATDTAPQAYDLADALVAGNLAATLSLAEDLKAHDERPARLIWPIVKRLREVHRAARLLDAGMPDKKVADALRAPPWLAKKTVGSARKADRAVLERAICLFAELEVESRGGGDLDEDTAFSLTLERAAGRPAGVAGA
jgi:DNA polymerase III subunit delta